MLGNTADFIASQMASGSVDSAMVQSVGTSLFSGIGNVLNAASSKAGPDTEEEEEDSDHGKDAGNDKAKENKEKVCLGSCKGREKQKTTRDLLDESAHLL